MLDAPRLVEQLVLGEDARRRFHQYLQQPQRLRPEPDLAVLSQQPAGPPVQHEPGEPQAVCLDRLHFYL